MSKLTANNLKVSSDPILRVNEPAEVPGQPMYGDWALPGRPYSYLDGIGLVKKHWPEKRAQPIRFSDICGKPGDWFGGNSFTGPRYEAADPRYPGIVVRDMPNPCDRPYRMIDGRRRMEKLRRRGFGGGQFFVFEYAECAEFIFDFELEVGQTQLIDNLSSPQGSDLIKICLSSPNELALGPDPS